MGPQTFPCRDGEAAIFPEGGSRNPCLVRLRQTSLFCDGSHVGSRWTPKLFTTENQENVVLCGCRYSRNRPFCEGSHLNLGSGLDRVIIRHLATWRQDRKLFRPTGNDALSPLWTPVPDHAGGPSLSSRSVSDSISIRCRRAALRRLIARSF